MSFIVAIDGPAGVGKGTIANLIAEKFGFLNVDTGAMYRAISYYLIKNNISLEDTEEVKKALKSIEIDIEFSDNEQVLYLNGEKLISELRTKEVNSIVSQVSHIPEVRTAMVELQRKIAIGKNMVMDGRDIGTNVFPNANVKIFLDATPEERANRRMKQNKENGIDIPYEEVLENIKFRDHNDRTSEVAPLKKADDAILIDCTELSLEELSNKVYGIIEEKMKEENTITTEERLPKKKTVIQEFDKQDESLWMKFQRRFIWHTLRGFYKIFYRLEVKGLENIPEEGAFIVCGNHVDFMKVPVIVIYATRKINFIGKAELFKNPFLARLGKLFDVIPVKRGKQDVDSMKNSLRVLARGEGLGLFPEGTRNGLAKKVKVKNGAAFMALRTGKPIVPVGIKVSRAKIIVNYGAPLDYSKYQSKTPEKETLDKVTEELMNTIIQLTNEA